MGSSEYISSGILELYAMGSLSAEERKEVENMTAQHPDVAKELMAIQEALNDYAGIYERNPHPSVRAEIMQKIIPNPQNQQPTARLRVLRTKRQRSPAEKTYKYLLVACIAALFISTFASVFFYGKWGEMADQYTAQINEKNRMAQNLNLVKYENDKMNADMAVMHDPSMAIIALYATDSTRQYKARVYWSKANGQAYIDVQDLPTPAADKQYQLWALVGGQPVDAGTFNMDEAGMQKVKAIVALNIGAWAVTLEPKGGSATPTMNQMYLIGKT